MVRTNQIRLLLQDVQARCRDNTLKGFHPHPVSADLLDFFNDARVLVLHSWQNHVDCEWDKVNERELADGRSEVLLVGAIGRVVRWKCYQDLPRRLAVLP